MFIKRDEKTDEVAAYIVQAQNAPLDEKKINTYSVKLEKKYLYLLDV